MQVKELADISGVKKSAIDSYLNNRERIPSAEAALRLARALGVSVEHLFGEREEQTEPDGSAQQEGRTAQEYYKEEKLVSEVRELAKHLEEFADRLEQSAKSN
jgi:transcriptional regulator with XRE-family HTH domain